MLRLKLALCSIVPLISVVGCATTTTTTTIEEEEEAVNERTSPSRSRPPPRPTPAAEKSTVKNPFGASTNPERAPHAEDAEEVCTLRPSREDCRECCVILGGADETTCASKAACEAKAIANDCRVNGCGTGTSCQKCWTAYTCMASGSSC